MLETVRARHAVDLVRGLSQQQLSMTDGIVAVGGDGLFHEVINGLLSLREGGDERAVQAAFLRIGAGGVVLVFCLVFFVVVVFV